MKYLRTVGFVLAAILVYIAPTGALDRVRQEANVDAAVAKYGVSGQGVLIAILDRGLDWRSDDFRNADGSTRIAGMFDLTDDTGALAPGNTYKAGTLYTRQQIDAALQGGPGLATRDAVGHGTVTTGIAAGNGRNSAGTYRGVAPNATLLIVKVTSDGAPTHDGQAAEAAYFSYSRLFQAIDYVRDQAAALRMPCVMLLNLGSQIGPADGTSSLARKIDSIVGPGIPGLIFVTGTGDEGGVPNRAGGSVTAGMTTSIQIRKAVTGNLYFDLWYPDTDRFTVSVTTPSGTRGPYVSPPTNTASDHQTSADVEYSHYGSSVDRYSATNAKREIYINLTGPPGDYAVNLTGASVTQGRFDAIINPTFFGSAYSANRFMSHVAPGSIWEGATAFNNIAPNCYVIRTSWIDIDGISRTATGQGSVGEIWPGSSVGPTYDGRLGVDLSAPGEYVVGAYSPTSYWGTFRHNLIKDGGGLYGMGGAVSAAAPVVTGVIALMLEVNKGLDATQVKKLLQQSARGDAFTGVVPNTVWGYGKLDALGALDAVANCGYGVSSSTVTAATAGGSGTIAVAASATCSWSAVSGSPFVTITSGANGTGSGSVTYSLAPNTAFEGRTATLTIAGKTVTITQPGTGPTVSIERSALRFGATNSGTAFVQQTPSQTVQLAKTGTGSVTWTATSNQPWLTVSPASGTGSAALSIGVVFNSGVPVSGTVSGAVTLSLAGAGTTAGPISVTLTSASSTGAPSPPFGVVDTPVGDATVLAGSIAVTGWTLDNIGVQRVELWRELQPGETTAPFASTPGDPRHGKVFIANATFVDGARPDVEAMNATTPLAHRAGWGYLLLTWGLWNQGNGTYKLHVFAFDEENNLGTIGSKTVVVSNTTATKPFGSIDTPAIGGDASGPNFGWGLTPKVNGVATCKIQPSGVQVSIDSGPLRPVVYGDARPDIAAGFPGFSNTAGAGGHFIIDWSTLANGPHTIGWLITDDCSRADGVGSRFFTVNSGTSTTAVATVANAVAARGAESTAAITVRRGYGGPPTIVAPGRAGDRTIVVKQGGRIEVSGLHGFQSAHQVVAGGERRAPPMGTTWDASSGTFYWQPAPAFLGVYRIVFTNGTKRLTVRVVVVAASSS